MIPVRLRELRAVLAALAVVGAACGRAAAPPPDAAPPPPVPRVAADTAAARDSVVRDSIGRTLAELASPELPDVPARHGPLDLRVVYPAAGALLDVRDSTFVFGSVGTGDARLAINGVEVPVWPNGAWLAWVSVPRDSVVPLELVVRTATDSSRLIHLVRRAPRYVPPAGAPVWIDTTSLAPRGAVWVPPDEFVPLRLRAPAGAVVRVRLADGTVIPFVPDRRYDEVPEAIRAFDRDPANLQAAIRADRYVGLVRGRPIGPDPGPVLPVADSLMRLQVAGTACRGGGCAAGSSPAPPVDSLWPVVEVIRGADTARAFWRVQVALLDSFPLVTELDDDPLRLGTSDGITVGRAAPGATYHWFFPVGTRAQVTGRTNADLRLRIADGVDVWVAAVDGQLLPRGTPAPRATVGSLTLTPWEDRVSVRIPLSQRVPFQIAEGEREITLDLYGATGDINWIRYGGRDSLVSRAQWAQAPGDVLRLTLELAEPVWGYRTRWDRSDLILDVRRPPPLDAGAPLEDLVVVVDPGHPPGGATGPTGFRESEANLAVSLELAELLADAGADVRLTRASEVPVDLLARIRFADSVGAHLLVSIHNNALPDGVNPLTNNGTSVFYNHPRSLPLARAVQSALVRRLGLRDLGVARGDLAMVRPTWMPAVLTEGLFMIVPDQEAALRSREGQRRYALGVFDGIRQFLRERARER